MERQEPRAIAFEALRFDERVTDYFLFVFWQKCLIASGEPVFWPPPRKGSTSPEAGPTP